MANEQNLKSFKDKTASEQRKIASAGGVASGKARREKKAMKKTLEALLSMPLENGSVADIEEIQSVAAMQGKNVTVQEAVMFAQIKKALKGDTKAAEFIRDTSGNKLKDAVEVSGGIINPFADLTTEELRKLASQEDVVEVRENQQEKIKTSNR